MRKNKYGVSEKSERTLNGVLYASKKEKTYRQKLELLKSATNLSERVICIEEQVTFPLVVNGVKICSYRLDFKVTYADGRIDWVDVKGYTKGAAYQIFKVKKQLMIAVYGINIKEV